MSGLGQKSDKFELLEQMIYIGQWLSTWKDWSHPPDSNRRPTDYESVALPTELGWLKDSIQRRLTTWYLTKEGRYPTSPIQTLL